jgi:hypothetical protein
MNGSEFFIPVAISGVFLAGFTGLIAINRKMPSWDVAEQLSVRFSLEFCLFATLFALLPYPLYYLGDETFALRISSMAMALFLGVEISRIRHYSRKFGSHWSFTMVLLLALSTIFLTIEFVNALVWNSLAGYTAGLLWIVLLAGIQFIAFIIYNKQNHRSDNFHRIDFEQRHQRVWSSGEPRDSYHTSNTGSHSHHNGAGAARAGRNTDGYIHGYQRFPNRRSLSHTVVRSNTDTVRRPTDTYPRF